MKFLVGLLCTFQCVVFVVHASERFERWDYNERFKKNNRFEVVDIKNHPYLVSIRWAHPKSEHFCSGSIISKRHILTVAHCFDGKLNDTKNIEIVSGINRTDVNEGTVYGIGRVTIHPEYNERHDRRHVYYNDIVVVTLNKSIEFSPSQQPISLPTEFPKLGEHDVLSWHNRNVTKHPNGYWQTHVTPYKFARLAYSVYVLDYDGCQDHNDGLRWYDRKIQTCVDARFSDYSYGDNNGGALISRDGKLAGLASSTFFYQEPYEPENIEVYTIVYPFVNFIQGIIKSDEHLL